MAAFSAQERDALAKAIFTAICTRENYAADGKWITIGGGAGPGGEKHAGGTPVKLGPGGQIEAGPKQLEGKPIGAVDQNKEKPAWHGLKEEAEAAEKAGNFEKAARRWNDAAANHPGGSSHPEAAEMQRRSQAASTAAHKASLIVTGADATNFRDKSGAIDLGQFSNHVTGKVQSALQAGQQVTLVVNDGGREKRVPIVAVNGGMMQDAKGQRWGSLPIAQGGARIETSGGQPAVTKPPAQTATTQATPAFNPQSPPNVSAEQHAQVKQAVGDSNALVAYYRNGDYHFLHEDAPKAAGVLGQASVPHGGLQDALNKLVAGGHRVAVAEPENEKAPRQKQNRQPKPEPARPLVDQPPQARQGSQSQPAADSSPKSPAAAVPPKPAGEPPAVKAKPAPAVANKPADRPMTQKPQSAKETPAGPKAAASGGGGKEPLKLKPQAEKAAGPKAVQQTLFDKLAEIGVPGDNKAGIPTSGDKSKAHVLKNELGEKVPHGVKVLPNGQWVGSTSLHVNDLHLDPHRFQYKISGIDEKTGVTKELSESSKFNPDLAGQILVWRDPADGKTYVVNGHHRVELGRRSGGWENEETGEGWHGDIQARYINASSASEARAKGALANIAEGRGTATDAAKFMRDTGRSIEDLQKEGISIKGKLAADALQLKDLSPRAFQDLAQERLPETRAIAVAKNLKDPDKQDWLFNRLANREREGKPVTDSLAGTMAKSLALSQPTKAAAGGLFGEDFEEQTFDQRSELIDSLARDLASEKNIFKSVSTSRRVGKITAEGKNTLDVEGNKQRAQEAAELQYHFDREANSKGPVSDLINKAAAELLHSPKRKAEILKGLKRDVFPLMQERASGKQAEDSSTPPRDSYSAAGKDAGGNRGAAQMGPHTGPMAGSNTGRGPAPARGNSWDGFRGRLSAAIEKCLA